MLIIGSARHDENGKYCGGQNGDQDGTEVSTQSYYMHSKGWYVIRAKSATHADKLASAMLEACNNNNIGYDQNDRDLVLKVKKYGSLAAIKTKCDTDCSDLVRACVYQATGKDTGDFYTATEPKALIATGLFEDAKSVTSSTTLYNGDILVTKTKGHTVIVVSGNPRQNTTKLGWIQSGSKWYYRLTSGSNAHGWQKIQNADGKTRWYHFATDGAMNTGVITLNGCTYYLLESGDFEGACCKTDDSGVLSPWVVE